MKKIAIIVILGVSLAFGEYLRDERIPFPWSEEYHLFAAGSPDPDEVQHLRDMTREGVFDQLREKFFPELEVSLKVSNDQSIQLIVKNAKLEDAVIYCGLCRIYAELMMSKDASYIRQLDDENRTIFLKLLKTSLYTIYKEDSCLGDKPEMAPGTEKFPLVRIYRNADSHLVYLYVVDKLHTDSSDQTKPYYRLFFVPRASKEQVDELFDVFRKMSPELTRSLYDFGTRLLWPDQTEIQGLTPGGWCVYETKLYVQEEIDEQCSN